MSRRRTHEWSQRAQLVFVLWLTAAGSIVAAGAVIFARAVWFV